MCDVNVFYWNHVTQWLYNRNNSSERNKSRSLTQFNISNILDSRSLTSDIYRSHERSQRLSRPWEDDDNDDDARRIEPVLEQLQTRVNGEDSDEEINVIEETPPRKSSPSSNTCDELSPLKALLIMTNKTIEGPSQECTRLEMNGKYVDFLLFYIDSNRY